MKLLKPVLAAIFLLASNYLVFERVLDMVESQLWVSLSIYLGVLGICTLAYIFTLFHENKVIQSLGAIVMAASAAFGMSYLNISGHYLNYMDIELLWFSRDHIGNALFSNFNQIIFPVLISLTGLVAGFLSGEIVLKKSGFRLLRNIVILLPYPILAGLTFVKAGYGTVGMPQQYSSVSTFLFMQAYERATEGMVEIRKPFTLKPKAPAWSNNIILIVDQSIRSDYLDLNTKVGTTPFLKSIEDKLINFGRASSSNNCTGYSNAVLRMGGIRGKLENIGSNPLIWSFAKKAGYTTWYLDAQLKKGELQNFMDQNEASSIDNFIQLDKVAKPYSDHKFVSQIDKILKNGKKNFIYMNKRGAHFPYIESYETDRAKFLPQMESGDALGNSKEELVNSYKNAVWWNTDEFFKLLMSIDLEDSFIFYTSDHGQNLMDSGIQTHCNTRQPHGSEGDVPIFLIPTEKRKKEVQGWKRVSHNKTSHFQIFPTILFTMGYAPLEVIDEYGPGLNQKPFHPQEFSSGPIMPKFGKKVEWNSINR